MVRGPAAALRGKKLHRSCGGKVRRLRMTKLLENWRNLEGFAHHDFAVANEKLRGTLVGAANYGQQAVDLFAGDQAQHAA